ncbi:MAG: glutamine synthetase family protein [Leptolyngbyaceae cyanobacterium MO_188.B28]|nr:glutamine synthetase family protein [Leptolyngbyaceae cyanobacterium MO_188.B28]
MADSIPESLQKQGVKFVRVLWCDNANVIRGKAIHIGALSRHIKYGVSLSAAQQAIPVMYDAVAPGSGLGPVGEVWLTPDWSTLTVLPYAPSHARVLGDMAKDGEPWPWCSRQFLKRMIQAAAALGVEVMAAFEPEFYLLQVEGDKVAPADETVFAASLSMDIQRAVIDAIADALIAQNIPVEQYYPESGPGQQEITVRYTHALQAADQHIVLRETVRAIARQHGLRASFAAKIFESSAGSGCHLHLSLWRNGQNQMPDGNGELSPIARSFIAGILEHLPGLMAITTPSCNSYRRIRPHAWSGAFRAWGWDNREAAVRIPSNPESPSPTQIELKTVDGSANPYLALGSVIAAGLEGIRRRLDPVEPVAVDPGMLTDEERTAHGITPLPTDLQTALEHLRQNSSLLEALGTPLATTFLAVRQAEWEAMHSLNLTDEVKLLLERY